MNKQTEKLKKLVELRKRNKVVSKQKDYNPYKSTSSSSDSYSGYDNN